MTQGSECGFSEFSSRPNILINVILAELTHSRKHISFCRYGKWGIGPVRRDSDPAPGDVHISNNKPGRWVAGWRWWGWLPIGTSLTTLGKSREEEAGRGRSVLQVLFWFVQPGALVNIRSPRPESSLTAVSSSQSWCFPPVSMYCQYSAHREKPSLFSSPLIKKVLLIFYIKTKQKSSF